MRIKLLKPLGNYRAGVEINHPWAIVALRLIAEGAAVAAEPCDGHTKVAASQPQRKTARRRTTGAN